MTIDIVMTRISVPIEADTTTATTRESSDEPSLARLGCDVLGVLSTTSVGVLW